jgi:flagellar motor switch/type III secretory pathway protein FliN
MAASAAPAVSPAVAAKSPEKKETEEEARWRPLLRLPCLLTVEVPGLRLRVSDFLALRPGSVVATHWGVSRDVPLRINGTLIGWGELESAGNHLAVRLTELA